MNRKLAISIAASLAAAPLLLASSANAETCIPSDAQTVVVPAVTEVVIVVDIPGIPETLADPVWHTYKGKFDGEGSPSADDSKWKANEGNPQSENHAFENHTPGVPYFVSGPGNGNPGDGNGKGDWFMWTQTVIPAVEAVTHTEIRVVTPESETEIPAVVCPVVTPEPPVVTEPTPTPVVVPDPSDGDDGELLPPVSIEPQIGELPATGADETVAIVLAGLGLIALGGAAYYMFGRRD